MTPVNIIKDLLKKLNSIPELDVSHTVSNRLVLLDYITKDIDEYLTERQKWSKDIIHITEWLIYKRLQVLVQATTPRFTEFPYTFEDGPIFTPNQVEHFIKELMIYRAHLTPRNPVNILFGQMKVNTHFQGSGGDPTDWENTLANQPLGSITAKQLGYGLGCRLTVAIINGRYITLNNRTLTAHCIANVRPLRLKFRDATVDEINRLNEQDVDDSEHGFRKLQYTPEAVRMADGPRTLPSDWMPIEGQVEQKPKVIKTVRIPNTWSYF